MNANWRRRPLTDWPSSLPHGDSPLPGWSQTPDPAIQWNAERRRAVVDAIDRQYQSQELNVDLSLLSAPNSRVVVTGHQLLIAGGVGLLHHKIWSAISVAKTLSTNWGVPVVPVFWMATEDHDFQEISALRGDAGKHVWSHPLDGLPVPVGRLPLDGLQDAVGAWMQDGEQSLDEASDLMDLLVLAQNRGETLAHLMRRWMDKWYGEHGMLVLDADDAELKSLALPLWEAEMEGKGLSTCVPEGAAHVRENQLFWMDEGQGRVGMVPAEESTGWRAGSQSWLRPEQGWRGWCEEHAKHCSPGVLLRPLYQEWLLQSAAVVVGPGEWAYWDQVRSGFEHHQLNFPALRLRDHVLWIPDEVKQFRWKPSNGWCNAEQWGKLVLDQWMEAHHADFDQIDAHRKSSAAAMDQLSSQLGPGMDAVTGAFWAQVDKAMQGWTKKARRVMKSNRHADWVAAERAGALLVREGLPQDRWMNTHAMASKAMPESGADTPFDLLVSSWLGHTESGLEAAVWFLEAIPENHSSQG